MSGPGIIMTEPAQMCELCGVVEECRPYGPNNEQICFSCGRKNPEVTEQRMIDYLSGSSLSRILIK